MDDRGTLYTQRGGYTMTGDISGVLDLLNGWFRAEHRSRAE